MPEVCDYDQVLTAITDIWLDSRPNTSPSRSTRSYGKVYITCDLSSLEPLLYLAFLRGKIRHSISHTLRNCSNTCSRKMLCGENMRRTGKGNIRLSITGRGEFVMSEKFKLHKRGRFRHYLSKCTTGLSTLRML
jgi:hypothetical protein